MSDFEKLINASDLIEWIMETYPDWCEGAVRGIVDHVDGLPSAQLERKTGKWIDCGWSIRCSECDYSMPWAVRNYCPRCGAKMLGEVKAYDTD